MSEDPNDAGFDIRWGEPGEALEVNLHSGSRPYDTSLPYLLPAIHYKPGVEVSWSDWRFEVGLEVKGMQKVPDEGEKIWGIRRMFSKATIEFTPAEMLSMMIQQTLLEWEKAFMQRWLTIDGQYFYEKDRFDHVIL